MNFFYLIIENKNCFLFESHSLVGGAHGGSKRIGLAYVLSQVWCPTVLLTNVSQQLVCQGSKVSQGCVTNMPRRSTINYTGLLAKSRLHTSYLLASKRGCDFWLKYSRRHFRCHVKKVIENSKKKLLG